MFTCFLNMYLYVSRQISDRVRVQILVQKHKQETQGQNKKTSYFSHQNTGCCNTPCFGSPTLISTRQNLPYISSSFSDIL